MRAKRKPTSRFRRTDVFSRRIVITVSRSGIAVIAFAIAAALVYDSQVFTTAIAIITTIVAVTATVEARYQLRNFRYEMQERVTAQLADWIVPDTLPDLREFELRGEDNDDDGKTRDIRLPKR